MILLMKSTNYVTASTLRNSYDAPAHNHSSGPFLLPGCDNVQRSVAVPTTVTTKPVSGTVSATTPVTRTLPIPASGTYTVVTGDSLSKIARRFGVPLATLISLNNISDPNRIEAGQVLKLK
jgi:LysM repeat protein